MTDSLKTKLLLSGAAGIVALVLATTLAQDYFIPELEGYLQRKNYYERVISQKGLSMHKGSYWKEK